MISEKIKFWMEWMIDCERRALWRHTFVWRHGFLDVKWRHWNENHLGNEMQKWAKSFLFWTRVHFKLGTSTLTTIQFSAQFTNVSSRSRISEQMDLEITWVSQFQIIRDGKSDQPENSSNITLDSDHPNRMFCFPTWSKWLLDYDEDTLTNSSGRDNLKLAKLT